MAKTDYDLLWQDIIARVKSYDNIDPSQIDAFFSRLQPQAFSEGFLMLTADTDFIRKWIESHYIGVIKQALEEMYQVPFTIAIEVDAEATAPIRPPADPAPRPAPAPAVVDPAPAPAAASSDFFESIASNYSFETFVTGTSNRMAYSMAVAVAETPGQPDLNPLFIYGKSGVGKTHLLRSIQNYIHANYRQLRTEYVDAMVLVNDYTEAAINGSPQAFSRFKQRYEAADVLLIDDVQHLQNKTETLNIVFQILNRMVDSGKQVVLSADRAPKHIDIDERYQSRFSAGGTCDIQPPEVETKLGIIRNYIEECRRTGSDSFDIPRDVQDYVAQNSSSNIRELKSAIVRIGFELRSGERDGITVKDAQRLLADHFSGGAMKRLRIGDIQAAVERFYGISHSELVGRKRSANITYARQVAIYLCRTMIDVPFNNIGREFNRDHSTVMYSYRSVEEKLKDSRELNEEIEIIRQDLLDL